jgi:excisionase family DNA binding protein
MHATQAPGLLTVPELAAALRVHPASIYRRIQSGQIRARRLGASPGGRFRIPASELDRLLEPVETARASEGSSGRGAETPEDAAGRVLGAESTRRGHGDLEAA